MARLFAVLISTLLALCAGNALAQSAYVHDLTGTVTATTGAGQRTLKIGDFVEPGATVSTGDKSSAVIKFEDGQVMALTERSSFRIVQYSYNKQRVSDSSAVFALLRGGLRFISGVIGSTNRNSFRLTANTATIGIRGTDGSVTIDEITQAVTAAVAAGAVAMETPQGTRNIGVGEFSSFISGQSPTAPQPTAAATAAVQTVLNNLAATQNIPINTPVVVQASAQAAAAAAAARAAAAAAAAQPANPALQRAADEAAKQAQDALAKAVDAAQDAYKAAVDAGAVPPAPPAPPAPPPPPPGTTDGAPTSTGTSSTPSGGAGAGGGGTSSVSPN
jgi:hypothetical protein